jgi:hypothetical protein
MSSFFSNLIAGLSERERRLVGIMAGLFAVLVVFLTVFLLGRTVSALADKHEEGQQILRLLAKDGAKYLEAKQEASQRPTGKPIPLRTFVDRVGAANNITVQDVRELPDEKHGARWLEHSVELSIREVGLLALTRFMEEVESHKNRFPVAIVKLDIRKRRRVPDSYDVTMVISTYETTDADATAGKEVPSKDGGDTQEDL